MGVLVDHRRCKIRKAGPCWVQSGDGFLSGLQHVEHGVVFAGAHVQHCRPWAGPADCQFDRPGHILDMGEGAALVAVAIDDDRLTALDLAAKRFQREVVVLAWTPDGKEAHGDEVQAVELRVESSPLLAVELGQGIGTLGAGPYGDVSRGIARACPKSG